MFSASSAVKTSAWDASTLPVPRLRVGLQSRCRGQRLGKIVDELVGQHDMGTQSLFSQLARSTVSPRAELRGSQGAASSLLAAFQPGSVYTSAVNYPSASFATAAHSNVNTFAQMQAHQRAPRPFGRPGTGYTPPRPAAGARPGTFGVQLPQEGAADSATGYIPPTTSSDLEVDDV